MRSSIFLNGVIANPHIKILSCMWVYGIQFILAILLFIKLVVHHQWTWLLKSFFVHHERHYEIFWHSFCGETVILFTIKFQHLYMNSELTSFHVGLDVVSECHWARMFTHPSIWGKVKLMLMTVHGEIVYKDWGLRLQL